MIKQVKSALLLLLLCLSSCQDKGLPSIDPQEFIIGKWETISIGNWPDMRPTEASGFTEFTSDSTARFYDYSKSAYVSQSLYWITDSLLVEAYDRGDGGQIIIRYQYELERNWIGGDQLRLDFVDLIAINRTSVLRRIE